MRLSIFGPALALAAALSIAACSTPSGGFIQPAPPGTPPPSGTTAISAVAQKALYAAEASYNIPADAYIRLSDRGALPPDVKAKAKPVLQKAYQALRLARAAAAAGDSAGVLLQTGVVQSQAGLAQSLLPAQ